MSVWIWVVVVVLLLVVLTMGFARRAAVGGVDPTQLLLDPELVGRVRALAQANQKIAAIKMLRDGTPGLGLAPAKQMVDKMAAPRPSGPQAPATSDGPNLRKAGTAASEMMPSASTLPLEIELQARSMKSAGQPIAAIKLVREHTSWGLREAKEYVDGL